MKKLFVKCFTNNLFLIIIISLNALLIFIQGFFHREGNIGCLFEILDHVFTFLFIIEAVVKISHWGRKNYFKDNWNVFDFILIVIAMPSLIVWLTPVKLVSLDFLLIFRILRVFKFFRVLKFIPNVESIAKGAMRAIRSSVLVLLAFFILNFISAILSFSFFGEVAPEYFGNPLIAFYSTFKIFTVEGWYEIPDIIAENAATTGLAVFARIYFVFLLFIGGIFGLSLINSIFVDSMLSDNNDDLERKIDELNEKMEQLIQQKE